PAISISKRSCRHGTSQAQGKALAHPHPQLPGRAGKGLARVDRPAGGKEVVGAGGQRAGLASGARPARRRALPHRVRRPRWQGARVRRHLSRNRANRRLVFTWTWPNSTPERESLVTISFRATPGGTELVFLHEQFFDETV